MSANMQNKKVPNRFQISSAKNSFIHLYSVLTIIHNTYISVQ